MVVIESHEQEIVQQLKEINERLTEKESPADSPTKEAHC
jgi:hypothetical protein